MTVVGSCCGTCFCWTGPDGDVRSRRSRPSSGSRLSSELFATVGARQDKDEGDPGQDDEMDVYVVGLAMGMMMGVVMGVVTGVAVGLAVRDVVEALVGDVAGAVTGDVVGDVVEDHEIGSEDGLSVLS